MDAGIASLKQAQAQLKTYRQAVLKYAFEGKLTAAWREQHKPEPAEKLLAQIKAERETQYQQQLAAWQKAGTEGKGEKKPQKPKEFPPLTEAELADLPELPEGWRWTSFYATNSVESNLVNPKAFENYPHIAPDNIERFTGRLLHYNAIRDDKVTSPKHYFRKGQLVYSKIRPYLSKLIIANFDGLCSADMYPIRTKLNLRYLFHLMLSDLFINQASTAGSRSLLPKINQEELGKIVIPVCSLTEQHQIVQEIESHLSICDKLEEGIKESLQKAEALRQSILKTAFAGKLVPQDPNDGPVEKLLERIQAQKS